MERGSRARVQGDRIARRDLAGSPKKPVGGAPTFVWADDSGEDHYEVTVYDAFGTLVWEDPDVPGVSGNREVEVAYGGPPLVPGTLYQFRARSIKQGGTSVVTTEDLRGVFVYE